MVSMRQNMIRTDKLGQFLREMLESDNILIFKLFGHLSLLVSFIYLFCLFFAQGLEPFGLFIFVCFVILLLEIVCGHPLSGCN